MWRRLSKKFSAIKLTCNFMYTVQNYRMVEIQKMSFFKIQQSFSIMLSMGVRQWYCLLGKFP